MLWKILTWLFGPAPDHYAGDPYQDGWIAGYDKKPETANPYDIAALPDQHCDWLVGHRDATETKQTLGYQ